jgi:hypothetical protein
MDFDRCYAVGYLTSNSSTYCDQDCEAVDGEVEVADVTVYISAPPMTAKTEPVAEPSYRLS